MKVFFCYLEDLFSEVGINLCGCPMFQAVFTKSVAFDAKTRNICTF